MVKGSVWDDHFAAAAAGATTKTLLICFSLSRSAYVRQHGNAYG